VRWHGGHGERIPAWARRAVQDEHTKIFAAQVWSPAKPYKWKKPDWTRKNEAPIIYEAHIGMATEEYKVGSFVDFKNNVLPKIKKGGYNTIQLMAIQEHPYYGSFGYHVSNFFAVSSRFGTPDELKDLIDTAHDMNIAVIMDIVHSHAVKNELEGLSRYDGSDYQFFHKGPRGEHSAWDSKCFDYGKNEVIHFLLSNCKFWLEEYKFDGFRFDGVTSMLYFDHGLGRDFNSYERYYDGVEDDDAIVYLTLANKLIHEFKPSAISVAEDMSGMPGLAAPVEYGGYGFDYRLSMGVPDFWIKLLKEKRDEDWHVGAIYHELTQARSDEKVISYAESHDQALVGDKTIVFWLMDKEMYFNMHVAHPSLIVDRGMALHKMIRLVTFSLAKNGYLNFMGNEFGHPEWIDFPREGNNWSFHYARRQWSLAQNNELRYKFLDIFDQDMMHTLGETSGFFNNYPNFIHENVSDQVLVYERCGLIFAFNFNPTRSYTDYGFRVPQGQYEIVLNTDSGRYGGCLRVDEHISYFSNSPSGINNHDSQMKIYLPCQTALIFKKK
jgi:1,4-alpha-glucan branching enzyme